MSPIGLFRGTKNFVLDLVSNRFVISQLVKRDLKERYLGSFLGFLWPFLQQFLMVFIMSFVLQHGLRVSPILGLPFVAWLIPAQSIYAFFVESITTSSNVFIQYSYLVKKIRFKFSMLPVVKIIAALVNHALFMIIVIITLLVSSVHPTWYWFQAIYYLFATFCLVLGMGWLLSSLTVFVRDVGQLIGVALTFFMWVTPLFWNPATAQDWLRTLVWFNPVAYLTEGYRNTFLYSKGFWLDPAWGAYYWAITVCLMLIGVFVFRKLRPHFADVL